MMFPKTKKIKKETASSLKEKLDGVFSKYILLLYNHTCQRCGRKFAEGERGLTNSHFWGRTHYSTRWLPENCIPLCWMPCHVKWEKEKQGSYRTLMLKRLGQELYDKIEFIHNQPYIDVYGQAPDYKELILIFEEKIRGLHEKEENRFVSY